MFPATGPLLLHTIYFDEVRKRKPEVHLVMISFSLLGISDNSKAAATLQSIAILRFASPHTRSGNFWCETESLMRFQFIPSQLHWWLGIFQAEIHRTSIDRWVDVDERRVERKELFHTKYPSGFDKNLLVGLYRELEERHLVKNALNKLAINSLASSAAAF